TYTKLDTEGKPLWIRDVRGNRVMQYIFPFKPDVISEFEWDEAYSPCYDIAGNLLFQHSMDAGDRWMIMDSTGQPLYNWDSRGAIQHIEYDELRRPVTVDLKNESHSEPIIVSLIHYADNVDVMPFDESQRLNLRGNAYRTYD